MKTFLSSILLFLSSCNNADPKNQKIPKDVKKIIVIRSGALRLVSYLKAADLVVGIEENERKRAVPNIYAHPKFRKLPIFGSGNALELLKLANQLIAIKGIKHGKLVMSTTN